MDILRPGGHRDAEESNDKEGFSFCRLAYLVVVMAPPRAAAGVPLPAAPAGAGNPEGESDSRWLATLSEPELDLLISLKEVAVTRASNAGHPSLADRFHLRTLRALAIVVLQHLRERLQQAAVDTSTLERLALLNEATQDKDGVLYQRKRKHGSDEGAALSPKRRNMRETREEQHPSASLRWTDRPPRQS